MPEVTRNLGNAVQLPCAMGTVETDLMSPDRKRTKRQQHLQLQQQPAWRWSPCAN